jgi:hypothetical protein
MVRIAASITISYAPEVAQKFENTTDAVGGYVHT